MRRSTSASASATEPTGSSTKRACTVRHWLEKDCHSSGVSSRNEKRETRFSRASSTVSTRFGPTSRTARSYSGPNSCCSFALRRLRATIHPTTTAATAINTNATTIPTLASIATSWRRDALPVSVVGLWMFLSGGRAAVDRNLLRTTRMAGQLATRCSTFEWGDVGLQSCAVGRSRIYVGLVAVAAALAVGAFLLVRYQQTVQQPMALARDAARQSSEVNNALGEPLRFAKIPQARVRGNNAHVAIRAAGPRGNGLLIEWAQQNAGHWRLCSLLFRDESTTTDVILVSEAATHCARE